jgi:hypothetical protein
LQKRGATNETVGLTLRPALDTRVPDLLVRER